MLGYPKIKVLHGGFDGLGGQGLPVTKDVPKPAAASFSIVPEAGDILIDAKTMLAAVGKPGIALLDVRDVDEWIGDSSSPYGKDFCPRKGRIPGAVWLEWYRMMKPTAAGPRFKSKDEILAECATVGITQNTPVYLYCFKGARASNTFLALKNAGGQGRADVFRLLERMVARSFAPDRGRPADGREADRKGGIKSACFFIARPHSPRPGGDRRCGSNRSGSPARRANREGRWVAFDGASIRWCTRSIPETAGPVRMSPLRASVTVIAAAHETTR